MSTVTYGDGTKITFHGTPSPQDIGEAYAHAKGGPMGSAAAAVPAQAGPPGWVRQGLRNLPVMGGIAGGTIGTALGLPSGPGAIGTGIAGAGIGGLGGKALENVIESYAGIRPQPTPQSLLRDYMGQAQAGNEQALLQSAGYPINAAMNAMGRGAYNFAVKPGVKSIQRFAGAGRDMLTDMMAAGKPASKAADVLVEPLAGKVAAEQGAKTGTLRTGVLAERDAALKVFQDQVASERASATSASKALIQGADKSGKRYTAAQLAQGVLMGEEQRVGRPLTGQERLNVVAAVRNFANNALGPRVEGVGTQARTLFTPSEVDKVRQFSAGAVKGRFNAVQGGSPPPPGPPIESDIHDTARALLHGDISGLEQARLLESSKIRLNKVATGGSAKRIAMMGQRGEPTAQAFTAQRRGAVNAAAQRRIALANAPASATERQMLIANALSNAANRHIQMGWHLGLPGLVGGTVGGAEGIASHNPAAGLAVGLGAAGLTMGAMSPSFLSRTGLALAGPGGRTATLQYLARTSPQLLGLFMQPPPPDTINTQGR